MPKPAPGFTPPPLPAILIANDLRTGHVVLAAGQGWSRNPADAVLAHTIAEAEALAAKGQAAVARNEVVDATLVDVTVSAAGIPVPRHFRERFRILGPSTRPDLGKQAAYPGLAAATKARG